MNDADKKAIEEYLADDEKDYRAGVNLIVKHSRNMSLIHYLNRKEDKRKLEYELGKFVKKTVIVPAHQIAPVTQPVPPPVTPPELDELPSQRLAITPDGKINPDDLPETLQELYYTNAEEYKVQRNLHNALKSATTDEERAALRAGILSLDDKIKMRWEIIDHYAATGELPEIKETDDDSLNNRYPLLESLASVIDPKSPQTIGKLRTAVSRGLAEVENIDTPEEKRIGAILKINKAATAIVGYGETLSDETVSRIRKFIPKWNIEQT